MTKNWNKANQKVKLEAKEVGETKFNQQSPKPASNPPYNHCSLCGKWLGFWEYLQFWKKIKICLKCTAKL